MSASPREPRDHLEMIDISTSRSGRTSPNRYIELQNIW